MELISQIGHTLVPDLGVEQGDRVAIAMRNVPEWMAAFAAITSVGAIAVPMNARWQTDEIVFADAARLARLRSAGLRAVSAQVLTVPDDRAPPCHAMVEPGTTLDAGELQRLVGERLANFKEPTAVTIVHEQLPRNASGKILTRELRDSVTK